MVSWLKKLEARSQEPEFRILQENNEEQYKPAPAKAGEVGEAISNRDCHALINQSSIRLLIKNILK